LLDSAYTSDGTFSITGDVFEGEKVFTARLTTTSGRVIYTPLTVTGITAVPEPSQLAVIFLAVFVFVMKTQNVKTWIRGNLTHLDRTG